MIIFEDNLLTTISMERFRIELSIDMFVHLLITKLRSYRFIFIPNTDVIFLRKMNRS